MSGVFNKTNLIFHIRREAAPKVISFK